MRNLLLDLRSAGGLARTPWLKSLGHSPNQLSAALCSGIVRRPRIGWIALPEVDPAAFRAVQLGGRLAATNALQSHGVWVEHVAGLTVHCAPNAARLPVLRPGERRTFRSLRFDSRGSNPWRVSVADALIQFSEVTAPREWLASVDSALHEGRITMEDLADIGQFVRKEYRKIAARADARAASGNETYLRVMLVASGLSVTTQVKVPLVGEVDALVDGWLIVEADSRQFHGSEADQVNDRIRDGNALLVGFDTVRFMPESLRDAPDWCLEVVRARLRQGRPQHGSGWVLPTHRMSS